MYCQKHPKQKMTLLFTSSVCDLCDPPKSVGIQIDTSLSEDGRVGYAFNTLRSFKNSSIVSIAARVDKHDYLCCSVCTARFNSVNITGVNGAGHTFMCANGHKEAFEPQLGDKVECSQFWMQNNTRSPDYEWTGSTWKMI